MVNLAGGGELRTSGPTDPQAIIEGIARSRKPPVFDEFAPFTIEVTAGDVERVCADLAAARGLY